MKCSTVKPVAIQECCLLHGGHGNFPHPSAKLHPSKKLWDHKWSLLYFSVSNWCHDAMMTVSKFPFCCNPSSVSLVIGIVNQHSPSTCCSHVSAVHDNGVKASLKFKKKTSSSNQSWRKISNHRWIPDSNILVCNRKIMIYNISKNASGHFSKSQASALAEEHQENIKKPWFLVGRKALGDGHSSLTTKKW